MSGDVDAREILEHPLPSWACKRFGGYEHDWLDCPDCIDAYEKENE